MKNSIFALYNGRLVREVFRHQVHKGNLRILIKASLPGANHDVDLSHTTILREGQGSIRNLPILVLSLLKVVDVSLHPEFGFILFVFVLGLYNMFFFYHLPL
jgi:hypothetical protein